MNQLTPGNNQSDASRSDSVPFWTKVSLPLMGLIIVALFFVAFFSNQFVNRDIEKTTRAIHRLDRIAELNLNVRSAQDDVTSYLLGGNKGYVKKFDEHTSDFDQNLMKLASMEEDAQAMESGGWAEVRKAWLQFSFLGQKLVSDESQSTPAYQSSDFVQFNTFAAKLLVELSSKKQQACDNLLATQQKRSRMFFVIKSIFFSVLGIALVVLAMNVVIVKKFSTRQLLHIEENYAEIRLREAAINALGDSICLVDPESKKIFYANDAFCQLVRTELELLSNQSLSDVLKTETMDENAFLHESVLEGEESQLILSCQVNGDKNLHLDVRQKLYQTESGYLCIFVTIQDVTDKITLERRLNDAAKLEAIGHLAGCVAHDFNNYLMVIQSNAELIKSGTTKEHSDCFANTIIEASIQSANLTRQLLGFARRQFAAPIVMDVNKVLSELEPLIKTSITEQIQLEMEFGVGDGLIQFDRSQIEQVILNLVINARDAMKDGGRLRIETGHAYLDSKQAFLQEAANGGPHVLITVTDTGDGMTTEQQQHIFEPFFSTKGANGTGLGLSVVHGIVAQNNGCIHVESEPGRGTVFKLYFPKVSGETLKLENKKNEFNDGFQGKKVLLVEDNEQVRDSVGTMLQNLGMEVTEFASGEEAVKEVESNGQEYHLLFLDVVLPGMSGPELAKVAAEFFPDLKVCFTSGFTGDKLKENDLAEGQRNLILKPFSETELREILHRVMSPQELHND